MKLKKVASICSKTKIFCLYDREESGGEVSQWLGDSSAIYPITGLPYMDEENKRSREKIRGKNNDYHGRGNRKDFGRTKFHFGCDSGSI